MDLSLLEKVVLAYLQKHPDVLERLVEALLNQIIERYAPKA